MNPLVVLNLGPGSCQKGLPTVRAQLWLDDTNTVPVQFVGSLPPDSELPKLYRQWQELYIALHRSLVWRLPAKNPIEFDTESVTNVSGAAFRNLGEQLQEHINQWLNSSGFRNIDQQLRTKLTPKESIRFIIETEDPLLQKLPWHLWRFFDHYTKAEVALSAQEYEQVPLVPNTRVNQQMRILVVLGHSDGINIQPDRIMLEDADAETVVLNQPRHAELDRRLRDKAGWDIFFFAGHSTSHALDETGESREQLFLNSHEQLSIAQLKYAFQAAIDKGLKLAIFNSCDGLGLARELADLNLPQLIAMREPIIDQVAHAFLKHFLQAFSQGEAFYPAVRRAREQLHGLESDFPGASWLPVIYQNPTEGLFRWRTIPKALAAHKKTSRPQLERPLPTTVNLRSLILSTSIAVVLLITGIRTLGLIQPIELSAYDHLIRSRRPEWDQPMIDRRLLVVEITEEDIDQYGYPVSDETLATALDNLQQHQPTTVGIDLHRYQPNIPGREELLTQFDTFENLITVCSFGWGDRQIMGHPPEFSSEQARNQVGFSDLETDGRFQYGIPVVRRHLLSYDTNLERASSDCQTPYSFSLNLALRFLLTQGVEPLEPNQNSNWQLGSVVLKRLADQTGSYQKLDGQSSQILLNYRFQPKPAHRVSFAEAVKDQIDDELIRNRIVLIGVTDKQIGQDYRKTPYGELPGVWIHAHGVSQVLGAVMDNRALLWVLPQWSWIQWGDILWIWAWAVTGGLLVWRVRSTLLLMGASLAASLFLHQICLFILVQGGWLPFIPALLALVGTAGVLFARRHGYLQMMMDRLFKRLTWKPLVIKRK